LDYINEYDEKENFSHLSWSMYEWEDMNGQLKWLVKELEAAEALGELVHIVGHVPPGDLIF